MRPLSFTWAELQGRAVKLLLSRNIANVRQDSAPFPLITGKRGICVGRDPRAWSGSRYRPSTCRATQSYRPAPALLLPTDIHECPLGRLDALAVRLTHHGRTATPGSTESLPRSAFVFGTAILRPLMSAGRRHALKPAAQHLPHAPPEEKKGEAIYARRLGTLTTCEGCPGHRVFAFGIVPYEQPAENQPQGPATPTEHYRTLPADCDVRATLLRLPKSAPCSDATMRPDGRSIALGLARARPESTRMRRIDPLAPATHLTLLRKNLTRRIIASPASNPRSHDTRTAATPLLTKMPLTSQGHEISVAPAIGRRHQRAARPDPRNPEYEELESRKSVGILLEKKVLIKELAFLSMHV